MYINDLVHDLNEIWGVTILAFADDIILVADTFRGLEIAVKKILSWCDTNKMKLNKEKSILMYLPW